MIVERTLLRAETVLCEDGGAPSTFLSRVRDARAALVIRTALYAVLVGLFMLAFAANHPIVLREMLPIAPAMLGALLLMDIVTTGAMGPTWTEESLARFNEKSLAKAGIAIDADR